ncbi:hypothetical protein [Nocardia veterana]|uniref:Uncharacterized protein n=1 Tax=Nocardia veterana TaxID=132249 RepID=A0A7X6RK91_9NOCA|nr:hypothetical protein [Nocardia veterana]NKY89001.1 hypothetical protein [Nocardia veterana]
MSAPNNQGSVSERTAREKGTPVVNGIIAVVGTLASNLGTIITGLINLLL